DRTMELLFKYGVNHIDTAASYGESEVRLGPWMEKHRNEFFLATKTGERTYQQAYDQIRRSLERLRVTNVDLIQLHNLADPTEWETALGPGGALEACVRARAEGLVRFIGVTGHGLTIAKMHRKSIDRFPFDSVLLPYNYPLMQNSQYAADLEELYRTCRERGIAVQTIKSITRGPWGEHEPHDTTTWYNPLREQVDIDVAVSYVLGREGIFLNTVGDIYVLPKVLDAASRFVAAPTEEQMKGLLERQQMTPLFV
ncbi:MAG: aldo/keto reductase, partial [Chloroflexi bacterium]|nr:aldo/keto reductase [Chloroflexota bacterium]